jgi:transposase
VHLSTEGQGVPWAFAITSASTHDLKPALQVIDGIRVPQPHGRPRKRPRRLLADKGYDSRAFRHELRKRNIQPIIPHRVYVQPKVKHRGRPPGTYAKERYQGRWKIERSNAWMDNYRRVTVRWDHTSSAFKAWSILACIMICLNNILR